MACEAKPALVTPTTLRAIRTTLGLTQAEAALLVGVQTRSWRHWEGGRRQIPEPVAKARAEVAAESTGLSGMSCSGLHRFDDPSHAIRQRRSSLTARTRRAVRAQVTVTVPGGPADVALGLLRMRRGEHGIQRHHMQRVSMQ